MSNIRTYDDLLREREKLRAQLQFHKQQIKVDMQELREEMKPLLNLTKVLGKMTTRETRNDALISTGSSLAIDLLARKVLPKNIISRLFLPGMLKNVTSHLLYSAKPWLQKLIGSRKKKPVVEEQQ
ncbi:hypothetical protein [Ohtaekwangia koreensis]|uniref:Uncharacterized protein n=1 Tax=Ohtaekwangia koreensis TaxID=688867 RepID=A0A1T5LCQ8_9BACT|nr:hypothetical protein [Ohtaekwangia koreensis]SKC73439.1 hypothetical protein SAMN05660236_2923 [Ohtaekwangia koreensis]